ncbi:MAG: glycosyltransferase family 2 protein [Chloroflexi bacterium]|nr:glycosyltransferase family 2 protein [Chloroflexota bacterium]
MITLFATPRPFRGTFAVIQRNAIASWRALGEDVEIILMGSDEGTAETAAELDLRHVPEVECNEYGTPLVSSLFQTAERLASHDILAYVNADVILTDDFLREVQRVRKRPLLLVGLTWGLEVRELLDCSREGWKAGLWSAVRARGRRRQGMDYFVFSRGLWPEIPPFAVGRGIWDEWLICGALRSGASVVDASDVIRAIHQNHDWSIHPGGTPWVWEGPEIQRNRQMAGPEAMTYSIGDATWRLTPHALRPIMSRRRVGRWAEKLGTRHRALRPIARVVYGVAHPRSILRRPHSSGTLRE